MIKGIHGLFYSSEPEALRAFIRDKLGLPFTDAGGGWLIFDLREEISASIPPETVSRPRAPTTFPFTPTTWRARSPS
jgi:hypothetical protein